MNQTTHQQARDWLLSGNQISKEDQKVLMAHLHSCQECQEWSAFNTELMTSLPSLFPPARHTERDILTIAHAVQSALWKKNSATRFFTGARRVLTVGLLTILMLALLIALPRLMPESAGLPAIELTIAQSTTRTQTRSSATAAQTQLTTTQTFQNASSTPFQLTDTPPLSQGTGGTIVFPNTNQIVNGLVMDDHFIYYSLGPGNILRQTLDKTESFHPEVFVKIQYPAPNTDGSLRVLPRLLKDHWLYYIDSGDGTISDKWTLRAINTVTLLQKIIANGNGNFFGFSVDGDTVAVSFTLDNVPKCKQEAILETIRFSNGQTHELDRNCSDSGYFWSGIALSGDRLLAIKNSSDYQNKADTYLFDIKTGYSDLLSKMVNQSKPLNCEYGLAISGNWIACNITAIDTNLYDLNSDQQLSFTELLQSDMSNPGVVVQGNYLYWTGPAIGNIYSLDRNKIIPILMLKTNEYIREMVIYGVKVAWLMLGPAGYVIGWKDIPQE